MKGRGGDKVKELQQNHDVHIHYEGDKIELEGAPNDVETVRRTLEAEAKELSSSLAIQEMKIDEKFMKHIIGKNGANGISFLWIMVWLIYWLIDWLYGELNCCFDRYIDWFIDGLFDWLIN